MITPVPLRLAITAGPARHDRPGPDPRLAAVVVAAAGAVRGSAPPPNPPLAREQTRRLVAGKAPAVTGEVMTWLGAACALAGQPSTVTVSAVTTDAHIHCPDAEIFRAWCEHLGMGPAAVRVHTTPLGLLAEATTTINGWALHVRLFGPAAQELS